MYHLVPTLAHGATYRERGVEGFLTAAAFDRAFTQYQGFMVKKLNQLIAGDDHLQNTPLKDIIFRHARIPELAPIFNYASMAYNNHFFFEGLSPCPTQPSAEFVAELTDSFGSLETLRRQFVVHADAMFGPGFVWLVKHNTRRGAGFSIMNTYLAGTPFPQAHGRRQETDMNSQTMGISTMLQNHRRMKMKEATDTIRVGSFFQGPQGKMFQNNKHTLPNALDLEPVLCLNTWEHVWLQDYGIEQDGVSAKRVYAENWWESINWPVVESKMGRALTMRV